MEQESITKLETELESITAQMSDMEEEHGSEEGAFSELDKINKANVTARLKEIIDDDKDAREEVEVLKVWLNLSNQEAELKKTLKQADAALDAKALAHYPKLTEAEIKVLVVEDKWLAALDAAFHGELDRISQALTQRVRELGLQKKFS
jgi:type I restriction enzyme M protein